MNLRLPVARQRRRRLADGGELWAQVTRAEADQLGLAGGVHAHVRPRKTKVFR